MKQLTFQIKNNSVVVRYVDSSEVIREVFFGFCHLSDGCTGLAIKNELFEEVKDFVLDMDLCRGQGYDGAGAVAGIYNGTAALIRSEFKKLFLYIVQVIG